VQSYLAVYILPWLITSITASVEDLRYQGVSTRTFIGLIVATVFYAFLNVLSLGVYALTLPLTLTLFLAYLQLKGYLGLVDVVYGCLCSFFLAPLVYMLVLCLAFSSLLALTIACHSLKARLPCIPVMFTSSIMAICWWCLCVF